MSFSTVRMQAPAPAARMGGGRGRVASSRHSIATAVPLSARPALKAPRPSLAVRAAAEEEGEDFDARAFRRTLVKSDSYKRTVQKDGKALEEMEAQGIGATSKGGLVSQMRETGFMAQVGDVKVKLAESYGFCWGVERAVQMAYEARKQYPTEQLWITNEIIHNPTVNQRLRDMEVKFIEDVDGSGKDFSGVAKGDVVILPAFGASVDEMRLLNDRGVSIVDTTCPWVSKVWNAVDMHKKKSHTSIIHGKWQHEETVATASFAGDYLIVKNMAEAEYVRDYILKGGDRDEFMAKFENAYSKGFDPDVHLDALGLANQTTMLKGETEAIGKLLEKTMMEKFGVENLNEHFMILDTICDATQERQDAMYKLVEPEQKLDIMLVVGGFNSSNTSHLQEIAEDYGIPSYWVDTADRVLEGNKVQHLTAHGELKETEGWLPEGPVTLGVTSGASTPDKVVEDILEVIFAQKSAQGVAA